MKNVPQHISYIPFFFSFLFKMAKYWNLNRYLHIVTVYNNQFATISVKLVVPLSLQRSFKFHHRYPEDDVSYVHISCY